MRDLFLPIAMPMIPAVGGDSIVNGEKRTQDERITLGTRLAVASVRKALSEIHYGEVIIRVKNGKVIWVDRHERERVGWGG